MSIRILFLCCCLMTTITAEQLTVVCTVPDLADLVHQVGGERVQAVALARPGDNPHFVSARPSFIRQVASADAFVQVGLDLEVGWAPALLRSARNRAVQVGSPGFIDCSSAITPLEIPDGSIDRGMGDVHPHGNPHYLLAPENGIRVVRYLAERLAALDPEGAAIYREQASRYAGTLARALYGEAAIQAHSLDELLAWHQSGTLSDHLGGESLGGWLQQLAKLRGAAFIDDHNQWPYLAQSIGVQIIAHLEPKAGVPPSSTHLQQVIQQAHQGGVSGIITAPWFDPRHARSVAEASGLPVIALAHQVGSRPGTDSYLTFCEANITALAALAAVEQHP